MIVVQVHVRVTADGVERFKAATIENARQSVREPGIARFDVLQQADESTRFQLVEVYRSAAAVAAHKETRHYQVWRDRVADVMAEPRASLTFDSVFPSDDEWDGPPRLQAID